MLKRGTVGKDHKIGSPTSLPQRGVKVDAKMCVRRDSVSWPPLRFGYLALFGHSICDPFWVTFTQ